MQETSTTTKRMRLRYAGTCTVCEVSLDRGEWAVYDKGSKTVRCEHHRHETAGAPVSPDAEFPKLIKVRYAGSCAACDVALPQGARAFWVKATKVMVCPACTDGENVAGLAAAGERVVGRLLDHEVASGELVVLHDRWIPGRGGEVVIEPRTTRLAVRHLHGRQRSPLDLRVVRRGPPGRRAGRRLGARRLQPAASRALPQLRP